MKRLIVRAFTFLAIRNMTKIFTFGRVRDPKKIVGVVPFDDLNTSPSVIREISPMLNQTYLSGEEFPLNYESAFFYGG